MGLSCAQGSSSLYLQSLLALTPEGRMRSTPQGTYLERGSVHACIQLCTRGYTVVYTRVYSSLLGRRYSLGLSSLGHGYFYLRRILPHDLALAL